MTSSSNDDYVADGGASDSEAAVRGSGGTDRASYTVGYKKPPLHTRFQPGISGNPRGRKKGSRGLKTDLDAELKAKFSLSINGREVSGTKQRLAMKSLTARAAAGDVKAATLLISLISQVFGFEDRGGDLRKLSPNDRAILDEFLAGEAGPSSAGEAIPGTELQTPTDDAGTANEEPEEEKKDG